MVPFDDRVDRVIEVKYERDEISDVGFGEASFSVRSVRRALKAGICISCDPRMNPEVHPEIQRLRTALLNRTAVEVRDLPGEWLVIGCRVEQHDLDFTVRCYFDLVEAQMHRPRIEPVEASRPLPLEPPEKVAARKLAKRILGYDPGARPPTPVWGFDAGTSMDEMRVSFAKLGALAVRFNAQIQNSFVMLPWEEPKTKKGG